MDARITMITLGVADAARSRRFYCDGVGWAATSASSEHMVSIDANGVVLALYGREALAADMEVSAKGSGFHGVSLAHNVGSRDAVDGEMARALAAGGRALRPVQDTFVECFHKSQRVASHLRSNERGRHTTVAAHLPSAHQRYLAWSPSRLIQWAETIGPATAAVVDTLLTRRRHPEQGYRSCLGVLRLERLYGPARVEAACRRAQAIDAIAYKSVQSILKTGLDQQPLPEPVPTVPLPIAHDHLRGTTYYQHHEGGV